MMDDGLLEKYPFDEIYGWHNYPYAPLGEFSICPGYMMAAADFFEITLTGKGGHAAMPQVCTDVIVAGSQLVSALQSLVSRETDPQDAAVLSVTTFHSGTGPCNVLPASAILNGTVRTFKPELRDRMEARTRDVVQHVAEMFRMEHAFVYKRLIDATYNHAQSVEYCQESVAKLYGKDKLKTQTPVMGGEDFGSFLEKRPGAFMFVGQGEADRASVHSQGLHTSRFDFNDDAIPLAVEYFADIAEAWRDGLSSAYLYSWPYCTGICVNAMRVGALSRAGTMPAKCMKGAIELPSPSPEW